MFRFLLLLLFWGVFSELPGQNLTGKWIGYFTPNANLEGKYYAYELSIKENAMHELNVYAITKFPNLKMAKAIAKGLYTPKTQLVSIEETKFEYLQIDPNMQACLMNNFLTYQNTRGHEVLQGTYMSSNAINGKDCGGGSIFLEKIQPIVKIMASPKVEKKLEAQKLVQLQDKKQSTPKAKQAPSAAISSSITKGPSNNNNNKSASNLSSNIFAASKNLTLATPVISDINNKENKPNELILPEDVVIVSKSDAEVKNNNEVLIIPWVLVGRENKLVKKIITNNKSISIDLYDNGTIDNDTINVYDNKVLLVNKKRLSYKAIHIDFTFSNSVTEHEVIIVAHNMGTVPPNTALMVYKDGMSRQELFITSTNKMNAKLVIEYQPISP